MQNFLGRADAVPADLQRARLNNGRGSRTGGTWQPCMKVCNDLDVIREQCREVIVGFTGTANSAAPAARQKAESVGGRVDE